MPAALRLCAGLAALAILAGFACSTPAIRPSSAHAAASSAHGSALPATPSPAPTGQEQSLQMDRAGIPVYQYGAEQADTIRCGNSLVWAATAGPDTRAVELWVAAIPAQAGAPLSARRLLTLTDGGVVDQLAAGGDWAVFVDFKQHGTESWADWWKLLAVNLVSGATVPLAGASARPMTNQAPRPSVSGDQAVWDELLGDGNRVVKLHDLKAGTEGALPLPPPVQPTQPYLVGRQVVFLDAATDPGAGGGSWRFQGGTVSGYDLDSGAVTHFASSPADARLLTAAGDAFTWSTQVGDPRATSDSSNSVFQTRLGYYDDRPWRAVGFGTGALAGEWIGRYDPVLLALVVTNLEGSKTVQLAGPAAPYAICGSNLYYGLAAGDLQGSIRAVPLG